MNTYLSTAWTTILDEGRGGFVDFGKYREAMTIIIWEGRNPDVDPDSEEAKVADAQSKMGKPVPKNPLDELQAFHAQYGNQGEGSTTE